MKKYLISAIYLTIFFSCYAQTPYVPDYSNYKASLLSIYQSDKNYNNYLKGGAKGVVISPSEFDEFCEITAYTKKNMVSTGQVYQNLAGCENYLQKLIDRIIKSNNLDFSCKVVLVRNHTTNAFAMHGEELFVQIGLLANVENESQLAFVLAHELSHLINLDPLKGFSRSTELRKRKFRKNALEVLINNANYSRIQERAADSFAIYALKNANLIDKNVSNLFSYVISIDSIYQTLNTERTLSFVKSNIPDTSKPIEKLLRSHPESFKRTQYLDSIVKGEFKTKAKLHSSKAFNRARRIAQYELLHLIMSSSEYQKCIDKAFRFHLADQADPTFIYFLMEALRRQMYVDDEFAAEAFLNKIYSIYIPKNSTIFQFPELLIQDDSLLMAISQHHPLFLNATINTGIFQVTNDSIFNMMNTLANKLGIAEAAFSKALYAFAKGNNKYLRAYVKLKSGRFLQLAKAILNDEQYKQKNETQLVLVNDIYYVEEKKYGYRLHLKQSEASSLEFNNYLINFSKDNLSEYTLESTSNFLDNNYGKLIELYDGINALKSIYDGYDMDLSEEKGPSDKVVFQYEDDDYDDDDKFDLFVLCPEMWELFNKYNLKSIDLVVSMSLDSRSSISWIWKVIYPPIIIDNFRTGSSKNSYWLYKTSATPFNRNNPLNLSQSHVNYKVNKYYYTNALYYLMLEE